MLQARFVGLLITGVRGKDVHTLLHDNLFVSQVNDQADMAADLLRWFCNNSLVVGCVSPQHFLDYFLDYNLGRPPSDPPS